MGLFGSSSASPEPSAQFSTRSNRQECWDSRDRYYACLTSKSIIIPPGTDMNDGRGGPVGKLTAEDQTRLESKNKRMQESLDSDPCLEVRKEYEGHCARSWIDYFNKRRVLEERQRLMYAQGKAPPGSGPAPGSN